MAATIQGLTIRPLASADLDAVVAIDAALEGRSRRAYFERRLGAALREPRLHAQFAATDGRRLAGYVLSRVLEGEFGREAELRLEIIGVRRDLHGQSVGTQLLEALAAWARRHGISDVHTQSAWNDHAMLHWLDARGFVVAPNHVVESPVAGGEYLPARDDPVTAPTAESPAPEINFDGQSRNDFGRLARDTADVRSMGPGDLADIVRIDRGITGRAREVYMQHKLNEAMADSAIRVSLTARRDDAIVGFLMARVDLGDYGRTEPVAVIDTIGVDPDYAHRGIGRALLSQLFANLGALRIERVETVVTPRDLALLGFLYDAGFAPSQRIPFRKTLR